MFTVILSKLEKGLYHKKTIALFHNSIAKKTSIIKLYQTAD